MNYSNHYGNSNNNERDLLFERLTSLSKSLEVNVDLCLQKIVKTPSWAKYGRIDFFRVSFLLWILSLVSKVTGKDPLYCLNPNRNHEVWLIVVATCYQERYNQASFLAAFCIDRHLSHPPQLNPSSRHTKRDPAYKPYCLHYWSTFVQTEQISRPSRLGQASNSKLAWQFLSFLFIMTSL